VIAELVEHSSSEGGFESSCHWIMGESKIEKCELFIGFFNEAVSLIKQTARKYKELARSDSKVGSALD
jgi:hypothetical protein